MHSGLKAEAQKMLHSYLAASGLYGEWTQDQTTRRSASKIKQPLTQWVQWVNPQSSLLSRDGSGLLAERRSVHELAIARA